MTRGSRSILLTLHACLTPSESNMEMAASIITAARAAVGMYLNSGVRKAVAMTTMNPVKV